MPAAGGFAPYATRVSIGKLVTRLTADSVQFVDPALGFALGYTYWFKYSECDYQRADLHRMVSLNARGKTRKLTLRSS